MLSKEIFKKTINNLMYAYPTWKIEISSSDCMTFWYENFKNFDNNSFVKGIESYIRDIKEYPTISELRRKIIDVQRYET